MSLSTNPNSIEITGFDATSLAQRIFELPPELRGAIDSQAEAYLVDNKERVRERLSEIALHPFAKMTRPFTALRRNAKAFDEKRAATIERFAQEPPVIEADDRQFLNSLLHDLDRRDEYDEATESGFEITLLIEHAKVLLEYYETRAKREEENVHEYVDSITKLINGALDERDIMRYAEEQNIAQKAAQYLRDPVFVELLETYAYMLRLSSHYRERYESFAEHLREYAEPIGHA